MMTIYIILNLIMFPLCLMMCKQESKRRKISFFKALGICALSALFLPIIGYVAGYIFISGFELKGQSLDEHLEDIVHE